MYLTTKYFFIKRPHFLANISQEIVIYSITHIFKHTHKNMYITSRLNVKTPNIGNVPDTRRHVYMLFTNVT